MEPSKKSHNSNETLIEDETSEFLAKKSKLDNGDPKARQEKEVEDLDDFPETERKHVVKSVVRNDCPYLGTIKRHHLDFDFEKLCSVSLTNMNVYACLVCGKYYQGRGRSTHAYFHSLEQDHHVFINLHNQKIFCLPDNYEVEDKNLKDIKFNLVPTYTKDEIAQIDNNINYSRALDGTEYLSGCLGLNNIKQTDYVNVIIQSLCRVKEFRDFMMSYETEQESSDSLIMKKLLTKRFAELVRKIWNPKNFKGHISPHEFMQAVSLKSSKRFTIIQQKDPIHLLAWLFDEFHKEFSKSKKDQSSIIHHCFQGKMLFLKSSVIRDPEIDDKRVQYFVEPKNFMFLTVELPGLPLHKDRSEKMTIPQVPLFDLLKKYNGVDFTESKDGERLKYRIIQLPKYLVIHVKRFVHNNFYFEKNPTLVSFPVNNLDLKDYVHLEDPKQSTRYNLLANVCHEGKPDLGVYKVQVRHTGRNEWFEIQDLIVNQILPQQVALSESYILIYQQAEVTD